MEIYRSDKRFLTLTYISLKYRYTLIYNSKLARDIKIP